MRYRGTDYSVPTAYGHREVVIRGYVHEVVICCGAAMIARHPRSYEREGFVFDPLHYLALLNARSALSTRRHHCHDKTIIARSSALKDAGVPSFLIE